ncbi:leucine-rich repeat and transmembrane domain-containing protein 2 [Pygocentrus nattereri]|uniref:LRRCT domain-containing protein n=1 Tax=Pygocentrus nattereri TaxID=42514 RepID=A0AAR2LXW8_PYGNA|nr:leucine-rich repeat and transmembrane domain-containing protein 2 [Pygocentrus nattereri]
MMSSTKCWTMGQIIIMLCKWAVRTRMNIHVHAALLIVLSWSRPSAGCPSTCTCNSTNSNCTSLDVLISVNSILNQLPSNLTSLTLSANNITMMEPGSFSNLSSLLQLDLSRNHLLTFHPSTFSQLSSLELLDLSSNFLINLPADLFSDLVSLQELVLRDNRLKVLSPKQFQSLTELQHLDLSFNSLATLPPGLLDGPQALAWLSLAGNKLWTLQRSVLEPLTALQHLQLEGNHWNCSCSILPFRHWLEWMLYRGGHVDSIQCSLPPVLQGRDLRRVPMEMFRHCSQPPFSDNRHHSNCFRTAEGFLVSTDPAADCFRQRHRPISVRRAPITVVVAGVVCGIVCVMMVVAATYGCIYAMLVAHQQQELLDKSLQLQQQPLMEEREAEPGEEETAPEEAREKAPECKEWIAFPPEVCV